MNPRDDRIAKLFLAEARTDIERYLRRTLHCLQLLSEEEIWWRPNAASNSAGNLVLHLSGNIRQWIISGLGGAPDARIREEEFSARGQFSRRALVTRLNQTVREAFRVLQRLPPQALTRQYRIQGFRVTGLAAVAHVFFHFSYHAGQIIYVTKLKRARDLRLTRLPRIPKKKQASKKSSG
jgi:uncharacterized damage-inducible protein DinB